MTELPAPLVPPDCDLRDFAFMPLDVARLRDSDLAANETPEACWAAVLLWATAWHQVPAGSIPDDEMWIAKHAGYAQRGKIAKEWKEVRDGALHKWIVCQDGRLYHPVIAEKALEAWDSKLRRRWASECARIKKHNQRHTDANVICPEFDEWKSSGCLTGQPLFVPKDIDGRPQDNHGDNGSKGQGEGQGQGQRDKKEKTETRAALASGFESWWSVYPHKVGKDVAMKAFVTARKQADVSVMIEGVKQYIANKPPDRPWCNPATWLNQGRWKDEPANVVQGLFKKNEIWPSV